MHWQPPPTDWLKLNWDVAIRKTDQKIGVGVVLRDHEGDVLATLMQPVTFCVQPSIAEARGLVTAAGDSMQVVNVVKNSSDQRGILHCMVRDIRVILADTIWDIKHTKRDGNKVAHQLAQQAISLCNGVIHLDNVIPSILSLVMADSHISV
ncbi:hypothetical protein F2P56_001766 [Juglans regia]|uniref:RNase H type-1 domain-containing protein n=1 Tax=Juglans regia TaxID=51240 RepID=A0A833YFH3_JUGRE|nr:hypothetical protein F2P56_001766 [Juglans regia]